MSYTYFIQNRQLCTTLQNHVAIAKSDAPILYFGEVVEFNFTFPNGALNVGDVVKVSVDVDKDFLHSSPMASASLTVANANSISVSLDTRTARFRDVINNKVSANAYIEIARWRESNDSVAGLILCDDSCFVRSIVSDFGDDPQNIPPNIVIPVPSTEERGKVLGVDDAGKYAFADATDYSYELIVNKQDANLTVACGEAIFWTPTGESTLNADMSNMSGFCGWSRIDIDLTNEINPATIELGANLEFALDAFTQDLDMLLTGYINRCGIEWNGSNKATLHVFAYGE